MIRILLFFFVLGLAALGIAWIADRPGDIAINWQGYHLETSLGVALAAVALLIVACLLLWSAFRLARRLPQLLRRRAQANRQTKGYAALSHGLVAVGAGNAAAAGNHAREARRLLGEDPLTLLLQAQAAQLGGDRAAAEATFQDMLAYPAARTLGHRGLHVEALRRGDAAAAHHHAVQAHQDGNAPWAEQAVFDHHTRLHDWAGALTMVEKSARAKQTDKATANRQRAVLKTAMAMDVQQGDPATALTLAREAVKLAPGLVPAVTLAARLLQAGRDSHKAERLIEDAWRIAPHPDLAAAFLESRPGATPGERLARARGLARLAPDTIESAMMVARAALLARNTELARSLLLPQLEGQRPGVRLCLLMADLEEAAGSPAGFVREWLARASRAPRDAVWMADGVTSDRWLAVSPTTGKLDAFVWQMPPEDLTAIEHVPLPSLSSHAPVSDSPEPVGSPHLVSEPPPAPLVVAGNLAEIAAGPVREEAGLPSARLAMAPDDPGPVTADEELPSRSGWFR